MTRLALADKMSQAVAERQARVEELAALVAEAEAEEEAELRASFRGDPSARHDATSRVAQIRRKRQKLESEREGLLRDLVTLEDEARAAAQDASRQRAEDALRRFREFARAEAAFQAELKGDLLALFEKFAGSLPPLWQEEAAFEDRVFRLCAEAGMEREWDRARDQAHSYRTARNFLAQIEAALRTVRLGELTGAARTAVEHDPSVLFRFTRPEESPAYQEPTPAEYVWIDMSSAPLVTVEGPHGAKELVRQWQGPDGGVHPAVTVRRSPPSDAQLAEKDPRTGVDLWRRVDASLLRA
jgi:hypothetical protein